MARRWAFTAAAVVAMGLAVLVGLRLGEGRKDCTLIGSSSSNVSVGVAPGWSVAELCLDDECEKADRVEVFVEPGVHSFRASLVAPDGTFVEHAGEVTMFEVWPNGEGCGTRRSYGRVELAVDGTVTTVDPWADVPVR